MKCRHQSAKLFHVCDDCGQISVPSPDINYFQFFGLTPSFFINEEKVQKEFYGLSRILHPDRFHGKSSANVELATHSFAVLNKALATLKSPADRARYLFELSHFTPQTAKSALPPELTAAYFELQEALEDQNMTGESKAQLIAEFSGQIKDQILQADARRDDAFTQWEKNGRPLDQRAAPFFEKAARELNQQNYLTSMARDLERKNV